MKVSPRPIVDEVSRTTLRSVALSPDNPFALSRRKERPTRRPGLVLTQGHFVEGLFDVLTSGDQFVYRVGHSIQFKKCDA